MKPLHSIFAVIIFFSIHTNSHAAIIDIFVDLQPVVNVNTAATGEITGTFDDISGQLDFTVNYTGLTLNNTGLVFHGPVDALPNGLPDTTDSAPGVGFFGAIASGSNDTFDLPVGEITNLLNGFWYVDLHTVDFSGGELRGHITVVESNPVPLPAAAWLFASALGGLGFLRRHRSTVDPT